MSQEWADAFKSQHGYYPWEDPELLAKGYGQQQALNEHLAAKKASEQPNFPGWEESYYQRHPGRQSVPNVPKPPEEPGMPQDDLPIPKEPEEPGMPQDDLPVPNLPSPIPLYNPYGYQEANREGGQWQYSGPKPSQSDPHSLTWQAPFDPNSEWWSWKQGGAPNPRWVADSSLFNPYQRKVETGGTWVYNGPRPPRSDPNYLTWRPVFDPGSQWWEFVEGGAGESEAGLDGVPDVPQWRYR